MHMIPPSPCWSPSQGPSSRLSNSMDSPLAFPAHNWVIEMVSPRRLPAIFTIVFLTKQPGPHVALGQYCRPLHHSEGPARLHVPGVQLFVCASIASLEVCKPH